MLRACGAKAVALGVGVAVGGGVGAGASCCTGVTGALAGVDDLGVRWSYAACASRISRTTESVSLASVNVPWLLGSRRWDGDDEDALVLVFFCGLGGETAGARVGDVDRGEDRVLILALLSRAAASRISGCDASSARARSLTPSSASATAVECRLTMSWIEGTAPGNTFVPGLGGMMGRGRGRSRVAGIMVVLWRAETLTPLLLPLLALELRLAPELAPAGGVVKERDAGRGRGGGRRPDSGVRPCLLLRRSSGSMSAADCRRVTDAVVGESSDEAPMAATVRGREGPGLSTTSVEVGDVPSSSVGSSRLASPYTDERDFTHCQVRSMLRTRRVGRREAPGGPRLSNAAR